MRQKKFIVRHFIWVLLTLHVGIASGDSDWTTIKPAMDSRIIYVSSSSGRDIVGKIYKASEISNLENPGNVRAFKSLEFAAEKLRAGFPDILLLKRGDEWTLDKTIWLGGGRSAEEKMTIMAYGTGNQRPKINSTDTVFNIWGKKAHSIAILGLYLYAYKRDPDSDHFAGWNAIGSPAGISVLDQESGMRSYLFEDNRINFFDGAISFLGNVKHDDIVIRRNVIQNSYNTNEHAQGIYANMTSAVVEENIFDHNGWYQQRFPDGSGPGRGQATIFNHNTYFGNAYDSIFRNNLFLRASSQNNKWAANSEGGVDSIMSRNIVVENNFYYGGEIGIGIGGNTDYNTGFRWQNINLRDNVLLAIGKNRPTRRNIGWYILISDWKDGSVCGNLLLHNENDEVDNLQGIVAQGHLSNVLIARNTITGLRLDKAVTAAIIFDDAPKNNIRIEENRVQLPDSRMGMIDVGRSFQGTMGGNIFYGKADRKEWFRYNRAAYDFNGWQKVTGDRTSSVSNISYPLPRRNLETYIESLGLPGYDEFFSKLAEQSRSQWDERLTASSINDYLRQGYGNLKCGIE